MFWFVVVVVVVVCCEKTLGFFVLFDPSAAPPVRGDRTQPTAAAAAAAAHAHGCPIRMLNSGLIHTFHQLYYNNKHCKISEILTYAPICRPDHLH